MKRTLAERVAFLMLSAALAVGAWAVTGRAACSVTAPYQFPVQPGTPEWVELSANARKVTDTYSEEAVMARWLNLFTSLTEK